MLHRSLPLLFIALALGLTHCSSAGADDGADYQIGAPLTDSTLALVVTSDYGRDTLSTDEFRQRIQFALQQNPFGFSGDDQQQELRRRVAENFVLGHLLEREADRRDIEADTALVNAQLRQFLGQFPSDEVREGWLAQQGLTVDSIRSAIQQQARIQATVESLAGDAVEPTDAEVETYRQEQSADNEQLRAQHILFRTQGANPDSVRVLAEAVLDSIQAGADFEDLARRYSQDPGSGQQGGDLGYFGRGDMVPPFEEAAYALADSGAVTPELVETQFGYHIIRLVDRRPSPLMPVEQARQTMFAERQQEAFDDALEALRPDATVHLNPDVVQADLNAPLEDEAATGE